MSNPTLNNLTIIIFSFNRHKWLKRIISYWSNYSVKLLVLDGSDKRLEDQYLSAKNIKYIHDQRGLYERLLSSSNYIDTEFVILGSDDEFYLPSALLSCVKFLYKEETYSSCQGLAIGFGTRKHGKEVYGFQQYIEFRDLCLHLDQGNVLQRITKHFSNYTMAHTWSVVRFDKWKTICKYIFEKEYNFCGVWDMQLEFLVMVSGKTKIIPELMWLRNNEVPGIRGTSPSMSNEILLKDWWKDKSYKIEKKDFIYRMKKACDELLNDKHLKFTEEIIVDIFECYLNAKRPWSRKFFKFYNKIILKIKKLIIFFLPHLDWHEIRTNKYKNLKDAAKELDLLGYKVDHKELNQIISHLGAQNED
jgi:glycosyltransferase domain-containing protein